MAKTKDNPIGMAASMQDMMYKHKSAIPDQNAINADLFDDIGSNSFSAPGDRPRGVFNNFASGLSKGIAHGQRSASAESRGGEYDKYEKVMNYFQEVNNSAVERLKFHQEREAQMEAVRPYAIGGLEVSYSGMPYDQGNERMRNLVEQAKMNNPSIKGDYVGYVPNSPIVNLRDEDGNITAFSLSEIAGEDVVKRVQGEYIDRQKLGLDRDKLDMQRELAPQKYEAMERRSDNAEERTRQMSQKTYMAALEKYAPKIEAASRVQVISHKMKDLVKNNPGMFQSVLSSVWDSNDPGIIQKISQKATNGQQAEAVKEMGKYIQELKIGVIKGLSKPNQSIDMIAAGTVPGKGMPDNSILKILDDLDYKAAHEIELNKEYLNEVKGTFGENRDGGDKYKKRAEEYISGATNGAVGSQITQDGQNQSDKEFDLSDLGAAVQ